MRHQRVLKLPVFIGLLCASCLPGTAQYRFLPAREVVRSVSAYSSRPESIAASSRPSRRPAGTGFTPHHAWKQAKPLSMPTPQPAAPSSSLTRSPALFLPREAQNSFPVSPISNRRQGHNHSLESSVGFAETFFDQEVHVHVASLLGGRVQMEGFDRMQPSENLLWGLPGAGSLPAWGVGIQSHPGVFAPRADESYGLSLTIRFRRDPDALRSSPLLRCLGRVFGVRGCHLD